MTLPKIHQQQTIVVVRGEVSESENCRSEDCAIDSAGTLLAKTRIFSSQF